jgi:hypothetical protein
MLRRDTTKPPPIVIGGGSLCKRRCALGSVGWCVDGTRSATPLVESRPVARPHRTALGGRNRWRVHHTSLKLGLSKQDWWSCRESNPGPAVPMLWALRA